ncbi:hypothetical protein IK146_00875 [Candidatus Saccharibacteria bacterium]|nr:hypothetical protein [Candidatus Saccharibacteria bacterium]
MEKDAFRHDAVSSVELSPEMIQGRARSQEHGSKVLSAYEKAGEQPQASAERPEDEPVETRFHVDREDFPMFSRQGVKFPVGNKIGSRELPIDETLGKMVGATAETIEAILGERDDKTPRADHVIYLDKSARPVSWLVDEFWEEFTDEERPQKTFLAIDRRQWLKPPYTGEKIEGHEYIAEASGAKKVAGLSDFHIERVPIDILAGIHGLYVEGGIPEGATPEEIMEMPTVLDDKNVTIVDEVSRSGATLGIARQLITAAIPKTKSVNGHVFWRSGSFKVGEETQMASTPVWYPEDSSDTTGRGVKDINELYYKTLYLAEKTNQNRALMQGAFVLGEPLMEPEKEKGQKSLRLRAEIERMHEEYRAGHILPTITNNPFSSVSERMFQKLKSYGVELVAVEPGKKNPRAYQSLIDKRDGKTH